MARLLDAQKLTGKMTGSERLLWTENLICKWLQAGKSCLFGSQLAVSEDRAPRFALAGKHGLGNHGEDMPRVDNTNQHHGEPQGLKQLQMSSTDTLSCR